MQGLGFRVQRNTQGLGFFMQIFSVGKYDWVGSENSNLSNHRGQMVNQNSMEKCFLSRPCSSAFWRLLGKCIHHVDAGQDLPMKGYWVVSRQVVKIVIELNTLVSSSTRTQWRSVYPPIHPLQRLLCKYIPVDGQCTHLLCAPTRVTQWLLGRQLKQQLS